MKITSSTNQYIKHTRALADKKYRDEHKQFVIEGRKLMQEALHSGMEIVFALVDENANDEQAICEKNDIEYYLVSSSLLASLTDVRTPQNIVCVCKQKVLHFALPEGNSLVLDHLQDPGNLGAIMRSAAAFNFLDIYLIDCVDAYNEKVVRSSMGNLFKLRLHQATIEQITKAKQSSDIHFLVADMNGEKISNIHLPKSKIAVIIGNEGNGVTPAVRKMADDIISIPMKNSVESLNASVSAGILMYELSKESD